MLSGAQLAKKVGAYAARLRAREQSALDAAAAGVDVEASRVQADERHDANHLRHHP